MGTVNTHSAPVQTQQTRSTPKHTPVKQQSVPGQNQTHVGDASQVRSHTTAALNSEPSHYGSDPHAAKGTVKRQGDAASHITKGDSSGYGDKKAGYKKKKTWQYKTVHNAHVAHATADAAEVTGVVLDKATKTPGGLITRTKAGLEELAHHNRIGDHGHGHGHGHGADAVDDVAKAAGGADDAAKAAGGADDAAKAISGADEAAAAVKPTPKPAAPKAPLRDIQSSNLSGETKEIYQQIKDQAAKSMGGSDDAAAAAKAAGGADEAATAAKAASNVDEVANAAGGLDDVAKAAGGADDIAHTAGKLSFLGKFAKGAGIAGALVGTVAGPLQISEGIKEGGVSGAFHTAGGVALTGSGVAGLAAAAPGATTSLLGATAASAAAPLAVGLGGAAAAIDGGRQVAKNWNDRSADHKVGAGMLKTGGGTAMMVGAGLMATGVGAPIGAALVVGGAVVTGATYLAENTAVGKAVTKAVGGAAHAVADGVSHVAGVVGEGLSNAASAVGDAVGGAVSSVTDTAKSAWKSLTSWW